MTTRPNRRSGVVMENLTRLRVEIAAHIAVVTMDHPPARSGCLLSMHARLNRLPPRLSPLEIRECRRG